MKTNKLAIFVILALVTALTSFNQNNVFAQTSNDTELYPVRVNGKEGYIDATGRMVIKPQFDEVVENFSEGFAPVKIGEKWGYIDKTGSIVINPQFTEARHFSEGFAPVKIGEKWGYIDKTGSIAINPQFTKADSFSEGLADVEIGDYPDGKCGYIDKTGKYVINLQYGEAFGFDEGLACVMEGSYNDFWNAKWWFIDKNGNYYFNQPMNNPSPGFHEGLAHVEYGEKKGFIDRTGRMVLNTQSYNRVGSFYDGLAMVQTYNRSDDYKFQNVLTGFIDKTGRIVIKLQYYCARPFSEGLSCVRVGGKYGVGRYGFIDKTGTYVINPQYDYAASFRGGIAPVVNNDQFQYIDKKGNNIWTSTEYPSYILHEISSFDQDWYNLYH